MTVSVGLPVFNGEPFIRQALDSVLAQSFQDWELVISDNASTDATAAICREYAARDPRIRFVANETNRGAAWNYTRVFDLSSGAYFKWLAADDAMQPDCLARCVASLDENPGSVLAYPRVQIIDHVFADGAIRPGTLRYERVNLGHARASDRFREMFRHVLSNVDMIFGLIRSSALRTLLPFGAYVGADECLLVRLAMRGTFVEVPEPLLLLRWHPSSYGCSLGATVGNGGREGARQAEWYSPRNEGRRTSPYWRRLVEHGRAVMQAKTGPREILRMLAFLLTVANWHRAELTAELIDRCRG